MRPIDADKLWTRLQQYEDFECPATTSAFDAVVGFRTLINCAPTLDLDDLRPKGRWIERYGVSEYKYECSICHLGSDSMMDFCGHCGADMRGGG